MNDIVKKTGDARKRKLGFCFIFAGADLAAFEKASDKEYEAVLEKTSIKIKKKSK